MEHYDSLESWKSCLEAPRVAGFVGEEELMETACELMESGQAEVLVTERESTVSRGPEVNCESRSSEAPL